jgi:hypothetical protein
MSASFYAKWDSSLVCGYPVCYWAIQPTQMEEYLYDPNHYYDAFFGPYQWYRYMDLYDLGRSYQTTAYAPQSGLCWQVAYDPNNYASQAGCNTSTYQLPSEGSPAGYGNFHAGVYPDPSASGGVAASSGQVPLY